MGNFYSNYLCARKKRKMLEYHYTTFLKDEIASLGIENLGIDSFASQME